MDAENYACRKMRLISGVCRRQRLDRATKNLFAITGRKKRLLLPTFG